jgi:hypothetical protein
MQYANPKQRNLAKEISGNYESDRINYHTCAKNYQTGNHAVAKPLLAFGYRSGAGAAGHDGDGAKDQSDY